MRKQHAHCNLNRVKKAPVKAGVFLVVTIKKVLIVSPLGEMSAYGPCVGTRQRGATQIPFFPAVFYSAFTRVYFK